MLTGTIAGISNMSPRHNILEIPNIGLSVPMLTARAGDVMILYHIYSLS